MINPQWPELPMSRTNLYGPKDVRAIEVRLHIKLTFKLMLQDIEKEPNKINRASRVRHSLMTLDFFFITFD